MASSTEEVSGANNDLSGGSRRDDEQFGVFKDFDFLEYESESVEVNIWEALTNSESPFFNKTYYFPRRRVKVQTTSTGA